jgi:MFS family permease
MISLRALREKIAWGKAAPSIFLVFNSFVWYMLTYTVLNTTVNGLNLLETEKLGLLTTYFVGIAVTAILGSKFFTRARTKSLYLWVFMGVIATFLLTAISSDSILINYFFALFLGASIGMGLPSCLSYFADSTSVENRGLVGGIIWSMVGFAVLIFAFLISMLGKWETIVALTIWRLLGGIGFLVLSRRHNHVIHKSSSYLELIRKREILLYLFPWVMFSLINFAEAPMLERVFNAIFGTDFFAFVQLVESAFVGIFAIIGGVVADIAGRKRVVIAGFVMLGIEYATLSVFSNSQVALYLFLTLDGITWGLFASVFLTVLWGDLGENYEKEKYYTLGGLPYLLSGFLSVLIKSYASTMSPSVAFSFASFFLFLAVVPLMYAPETLPEKAIRERELKSYIEKAKRVREKFTKG